MLYTNIEIAANSGVFFKYICSVFINNCLVAELFTKVENNKIFIIIFLQEFEIAHRLNFRYELGCNFFSLK